MKIRDLRKGSSNVLLIAEANYIVHFYLDNSGMVILIQMISGNNSQKYNRKYLNVEKETSVPCPFNTVVISHHENVLPPPISADSRVEISDFILRCLHHFFHLGLSPSMQSTQMFGASTVKRFSHGLG